METPGVEELEAGKEERKSGEEKVGLMVAMGKLEARKRNRGKERRNGWGKKRIYF